MEALAGRVEVARQGSVLAPADVDLRMDGVHVVGRIGDLYENGRVAWRAGSVREKYELALWVQHVALCAAGWDHPSWLLGKGGTAAGFTPLPRTMARQMLGKLVEIYLLGQRYPLLFFPVCSKAFEQSLYRNRGAPDPLAMAQKYFPRRKWGAYDEPGDYGRIILGDRCPYDPGADLSGVPIPQGLDAPGLARAIWGPAREATVERGALP